MTKLASLAEKADHENPDMHITPGWWREDKVLELTTLPAGTNVTVREKSQCLVKYVNSDVGSLPWQDGTI